MRSLIAVLLVAATFSPAAAQPAQPTPGPAVPGPPASQAEDDADTVTMYDQAFRALMAGELARAKQLFEAVAARSVDRDRIASARELARLAGELMARGARIELTTPLTTRPTTARPVAEDDKPDAGRASFIITTTLASTYSGVVLLDLGDIGDFRPGILLVTGTTAAGFIASVYGSRDRTITAGMADAYSLGMGLALGNGLLLASPAGLADSSEELQTVALSSVAIGGAAGLIISDRTKPTRAQVGFVGTTSTLGIATVGLSFGILQPDSIDTDTVLLLLAGGLDAGAALGMSLAPRLTWSSSRQRLVSLGIFLGALAGWGGAALITGAEDDDRTLRIWSSAAIAGVWGGFGLAMHLTRDMEPDPRFRKPPESQAQVMPTFIRGAPALAIGGRF
jgi:hypothetical protein